MDQLSFTIPEILSLLGVVQGVYILVYMCLRAGRFSRAGIPLLYFLVLSLAFLSDFTGVFLDQLTELDQYVKHSLWFAAIPLSVLLIHQIAQINSTPPLRHYLVILFIPVPALATYVVSYMRPDLCDAGVICQEMENWYIIFCIITGGIVLITIWLTRGVFEETYKQKLGKERYWLIVTIVLVNSLLLFALFLFISEQMESLELHLFRNILGLTFIYLVTTSLFRIYPQAIQLSDAPSVYDAPLNDDEKALAERIEQLFKLDKVYQEPTYGRSDLARELEASETQLSRIINIHFKKSFPQMMNEHRVEDAKRLLIQTEESMKVIAEQVGFNSLPSFNRAFKEIAGISPSLFRKNKQ